MKRWASVCKTFALLLVCSACFIVFTVAPVYQPFHSLISTVRDQTYNSTVLQRFVTTSAKSPANTTAHSISTTAQLTPCKEKPASALKVWDTPLPLTALASPWRSGNTWVRHLLQQATGIGTSAIYCDKELRAGGFPFECYKDKSRTLVTKTHQPEKGANKLRRSAGLLPYQRAIVVIRNPYDFLVANIYNGHTDSVPETAYLTNTKWKAAQPSLLQWWHDLNEFWLFEFKGSVLPVLYSSLLDDLDGQLRRMLNFLHWNYTDRDVQCVIENKEGHFHRKPRKWTRIKSILDLFTLEMQQKINASRSYISERLQTKYKLEGL